MDKILTVGFPISDKEHENRRAIIPDDIKKMKYPHKLFFEKGYGECMGIDDYEYEMVGCNVSERADVLSKDVICDPKIGDAGYLENLKEQIIFGWIHATQNTNITNKIIAGKLTVFAWEKMYHSGRHVFWRNNELAGEAAVMHAFQCHGRMPYETKVAVIGRGNTARGAVKILNMLGADVVQYDKKCEKLLREEIARYDAVVNCVLWDIMRKDHIIYREDLKKMKKDSIIIDVSCDRNGAVETSVPTTIQDPIYIVDGIAHYVVDHTPAIFWKSFTENNSNIIWEYIEQIMTGKLSHELQNALIIDKGVILDKEINEFQKRKL